MDCASAPALYESSAEYYSNEQKKSQKITQSLSKNQDLQQLGAETNIRAETRRTPVNVPSTTERFLRNRQRQTEIPKATAKTYQSLFPDSFSSTQRTAATAAFEQRRKNLVQLINTNFGNARTSTTPATYQNNQAFRNSAAASDYHVKEMQVAAETASFANNNNRQFLQDLNNKNFRPYPVYNPTIKPKPKNNPNLTTLYDIREKQTNKAAHPSVATTTKRPTLLPYTKSEVTVRQEPYTRPGVSLLKTYLQKEKNKTTLASTEKAHVTAQKNDQLQRDAKIRTETKSNFESATKIPQTTRFDIHTQTASSDRHDIFSTTKQAKSTTESSYKERRERLMRKLNLDKYIPTGAEVAADKNNGDQANKPSLTPKMLHSLAIYYATAVDNLSTTTNPEESETATPAFEELEAMEEVLPALFSRQTINKYSSLFHNQSPSAELLEEMKADPNGTYNELVDDLAVQQSQNPIATSPQIRELAQVFTHALSAYLQDPVQFRKVLSDIRPTHPSFGDLLSTTEEYTNTEPTTTVNEEDDEILGFSDDQKEDHVLTAREPKALEIPTVFPATYEASTTVRPVTPPVSAAYVSSTTVRNPFRCCGKISASYTSAAPTSSTPSYTNTASVSVNIVPQNNSSLTTQSDYSPNKFGGFQNNALSDNDKPYGTNSATDGKPLSEYVEATNLPTAWGVDASVSTVSGFESKKIRTTTAIPTTTAIYFTETESVESENEEELQRAHSQSFKDPESNSIRHGKQLSFNSEAIKKPAEDLEAPTLADEAITTIQTTHQPTTDSLTTTAMPDVVFTSPDSDKTTSQFTWSSTYGTWHSTVIDPITLNDGLSPTAPDQNQGLSENTYVPNTATTPSDYFATEQTVSPTTIEASIPAKNNVTVRTGRLLKDSSTESAQDLTTITDTVVEKAKEIMNVTTAEKLMNVMKKTKSKTVKRLILLLIQTCDDDHNSTAEASKKALLEALMAVSQKDMEDMVKDQEITDSEIDRSTSFRRIERIERPRGERRGKSLNFDPSAVNSLSNTNTAITDSIKTTIEDIEPTATTFNPQRTTPTRRGIKRFHSKATTTVEPTSTKASFVEDPKTEQVVDTPKAEARVSESSDLKTAADTRALELLRSLYTIAARWG